MTLPRWRPAYVGIGSNLEKPVQQINQAFEWLRSIEHSVLVGRSGLYRSAPFGDVEQPDFINAVAALMTRLEPLVLLHKLKGMEDAHGRDRTVVRWGPRCIDLDLLAVGTISIDSDELTLPHPGIAERNFVLLPWAEVAPDFRIPGLTSVARLAGELAAEPDIERLE